MYNLNTLIRVTSEMDAIVSRTFWDIVRGLRLPEAPETIEEWRSAQGKQPGPKALRNMILFGLAYAAMTGSYYVGLHDNKVWMSVGVAAGILTAYNLLLLVLTRR